MYSSGILIDVFQIRRVGVTQARYVAHQHLAPWLVHSYKNVKTRKVDADKKTVPQEPFLFEDADSTGAPDSGDEEEELSFNVPAAPQGEALLSERLPTPPEDKLRVLSLVRSAILEEKEPGGEGDSDDQQAARVQRSKKTKMPTSTKEPNLQSEEENQDDADESDSDHDDQLIPDIESSEEEGPEAMDTTSSLEQTKIAEKPDSESAVPDASGKEAAEVDNSEALQKEQEKSPDTDLASSAATESDAKESLEAASATVLSAQQVPLKPATAGPPPSTVTFQPRCRVRLPRPAAQKHVMPGRPMGPRLRMPVVQAITPPPRPIAPRTLQNISQGTKTSSSVESQPKPSAITESIAERKETSLAEDIDDPQGSAPVQAMVEPKQASSTENLPDPEPPTPAHSKDEAKSLRSSESVPKPEPPKPKPKSATTPKSRAKKEPTATTERKLKTQPTPAESVTKPTSVAPTDVQSTPSGTISKKQPARKRKEEQTLSAESPVKTSSSASPAKIPSTECLASPQTNITETDVQSMPAGTASKKRPARKRKKKESLSVESPVQTPCSASPGEMSSAVSAGTVSAEVPVKTTSVVSPVKASAAVSKAQTSSALSPSKSSPDASPTKTSTAVSPAKTTTAVSTARLSFAEVVAKTSAAQSPGKISSSAKSLVSPTETVSAASQAKATSKVAPAGSSQTVAISSVASSAPTTSTTSSPSSVAIVAPAVEGEKSTPVTPSTPLVTSPIARYRRMSESMALYKTGTTVTVNPGEKTVAQTATTQQPVRIRHISGSDNPSGTAGTKVARIPSILSSRALPSLESMSSRRVRRMSECSDGKPAEPQGTMLQLLEGITSGAAQTDEEPMDISNTESSGLTRGPQTPSRTYIQSSPDVSSPRAKSIVGQHASPVQSAHRSPIALTKSLMSSPIMSPRSYARQDASSSPASQRSPRALTNQAIIEMLSEDEPPSASPRSHSFSPRTADGSSPAIQAALRSPPLYAPLQTSPFTSPTKTSQAPSSSISQPGRVASGYPAVQKLKFPESTDSPEIRQLLKTPSFQRLTMPQPLPMFTQRGQGTQATRPKAALGRAPLPERRGASINISTGRIGQLGGQTLQIPEPEPMKVIAEADKSSKSVDTYIEVPVGKLPGFDAVKHITPKGPQDTIRVKLPPGYKLPASQGKMKFSIVTEDQARKMGFPVPGATPSSSATGIRPQRAAAPGPGTSQYPTTTAPGTVPASLSHSTLAGALRSSPIGSSLRSAPPIATGLSQTSIAGSPQGQQVVASSRTPQSVSPSMSYPSTAGGVMSSQVTVSSQSRTTPQAKVLPQSDTQRQEKTTVAKDGDKVPQLDGAGDSDDDNEKPSTSSGPPQPETPQSESVQPEQPGTPQPETPQHPTGPPRIKHSSAGRYSTFPKFKGCTPESSFHKLYQSVRLIPRPWRQTDGLVNKPTLKLMLESVLILIMSRPGITEDDITAQYNPILQPVPVHELLEMLDDIGCIHKLNIVSSHKPTLFSHRVQLTYDEKLGSLKTYIPAVDCVLKLGQFESQLTSNMSSKMREALETENSAAMTPVMSPAMCAAMEAQSEKKMEPIVSTEVENTDAGPQIEENAMGQAQ